MLIFGNPADNASLIPSGDGGYKAINPSTGQVEEVSFDPASGQYRFYRLPTIEEKQAQTPTPYTGQAYSTNDRGLQGYWGMTPDQVYDAILKNSKRTGAEFGMAESFNPALKDAARRAIESSSSPELRDYWKSALMGDLVEHAGTTEGARLPGMLAQAQEGRWLAGYLDAFQRGGAPAAEKWIAMVNADPNAQRRSLGAGFLGNAVQLGLGALGALAGGSLLGSLGGAGAAAGAGAGVAPEVAALYSGLGTSEALAGASAAAGAGAAGSSVPWRQMPWSSLTQLAQAGQMDVPIGDAGSGLVDTSFYDNPFSDVGNGLYNGTGTTAPWDLKEYERAIDAADAAGGAGYGHLAPKPMFSIPGYGDVYSGKGFFETLKQIGSTAAGAAAIKSLFGKDYSTIKNLLDGGSPITGDAKLDKILAGGLPAALGFFGAKQQADTINRLAEQNRADRAPFLAKANEWMTNPEAYAAGPGQSSLKSVLHGLSVHGNPLGSPTSLAIASDAANRGWQNAVTSFANLGLSGQDTRANLGMKAADADAGALNAIGYGASEIFKPERKSLTDLIKEFKLTLA